MMSKLVKLHGKDVKEKISEANKYLLGKDVNRAADVVH